MRATSLGCWPIREAAGCEVEDLEVRQADLEDVFLQIVSDRPVRRPSWSAHEPGRARSSQRRVVADGRVPHAALQGNAALLEGQLPDVAAPVLTAVLYLLIFGHVLAEHVEGLPGVSYIAFLVPGLVMMSGAAERLRQQLLVSLIQSKITGNLVFVLLPPLSHWQIFAAYVLASVVRGLAVGTRRLRRHRVVSARRRS